MTRREATHILIEHAAKNCRGGGLGYHTVPDETERNKVALAILKVWPEKHYKPNWYNLGLDDPESK